MVEYKDIYVSLLRFCSNIAEHFAPDYKLESLCLDAVADLAKLPAGDLIGLTQWTLREQEHTAGFYCNAVFGFRTVDDDNLMRLETVYMDYLIKLIKKRNYRIPIYKAGVEDLNFIGHLQFSEVFETLPVKQNDGSSFRMVAVTLLSPQHLLIED